MKRAISVLLIMAMIFTLAACSEGEVPESFEPGTDPELQVGDLTDGDTLEIVDGNVTLDDSFFLGDALEGGEATIDDGEPIDEKQSDGKMPGEDATEPPAQVSEEPEKQPSEEPTEAAEPEQNNEEEEEVKNPQVTIEMEGGGTITIELYPDKAPNTVNNFISLASSGFYDGVIFHRVIENFMIQGGDPLGTGTGGPGYGIDGEFLSNGFAANDLMHTRGVISMARTKVKNSAGSQFYICHVDTPHLDGEYAAFGKVIAGMDVVDAIAEVEVDSGDRPTVEQKIKTVTVDTFGVEYPAPVTNNNR